MKLSLNAFSRHFSPMKLPFLTLLLLTQVALCTSPKETLLSFKNAVQSGELDKAWELQTQNKKLPGNLLHEERENFKRNMGRIVKGWDFEILAELTEGDCAVIAINESTKDGQPAFDLDPVFLTKQDGTWKVVQNKEPFLKIEPEKKVVLDKLELWFEGFKQGALWHRGTKK